jgi:uncharacterized membrane protein YfcA
VILLAVLVGLGVFGAFFAGLLGVGGALLMVPLLLYVPPWLGLGAFDMKVVAAMSMLQVFFAALSGVIAHGKRGRVQHGPALTVGIATAVGSFGGGVASRWLSPLVLTVTFALMATLGSILMLNTLSEREEPSHEPSAFPRGLGVAVGLAVGTAAGLVGAGAAFLLVPLLITLFKLPTRLAIGTSLAITLWTATAGFLGKLVTAQIPLLPALALVVGALPGAQVGERVSHAAPPRALRKLLAAVTAVVAVRVWIDVLRQLG